MREIMATWRMKTDSTETLQDKRAKTNANLEFNALKIYRAHENVGSM